MALEGLVTRSSMGWEPTTAGVSNTTLGMIAHYDGSRRLLSEWRRIGHDACRLYWRSVRASHMSGNGWLDVGYAYFVCPDDLIFEGRGYGHIQAAELPTVGKLQNGNVRYIAVTFGTGPGEEPTTGQLRAWHRLRKWYVTDKGGSEAVYGHRDFTFTSCPGEELYRLVRNGTLRSATKPTTPVPNPVPSVPTAPSKPTAPDMNGDGMLNYASYGSSATGTTELPPGEWTDIRFDIEFADPTDAHPAGANPSVLRAIKACAYALEFGAEVVGADVGTVLDVDCAEYLYVASPKPARDVLKETGKPTSVGVSDSLTLHHSAVGWLQKDRKLRVRVRSHAAVPVKVINARVSVAFGN